MSEQAMPSVVKQLVLKDWQMHRRHLIGTIVWGAAALALLLVKREPFSVVGCVFLVIALILFGCLLPASNILNERKKQSLAFVMSLPVSSFQYTTAKLLSTVGMFLVAWLTLVIAAFWVIFVQGVFPLGAIPITLILLMFPFIGLSIITGMTMVGETEGWNLFANIICNSSYGLTWYFMTRSPSLMRDLKSEVPVWNHTVVTFLVSEFALIAVVLALTYYLQARKTDFV
jgi:hypothetical protein